MNVKDLSTLFRRSSSVQRYSNLCLSKPENIAEHSHSVAMMASLIYSNLKDEVADASFVDIDKVVHCSIFHDIDETETGDILTTTKYFNPQVRKVIEEVEDAARDKLKGIYGDPMDLIDYKSVLNRESGKYLKSIDFLSVVFKVQWEYDRGHLDILDICPNLWKLADEMSAQGTELVKRVMKDFAYPILDKLRS